MAMLRPAIIDPGNAPEFFIDGIAHYTESNGLVRSSYYSNQTIFDGRDEGRLCSIVALRLVTSVEARREMLRFILNTIGQAVPPHPVNDLLLRH